ncbi:hypothetical protein ASPBRDRAFT_656467 [Aspergillus brasiliensis CBS 101740]|uniref:Uncharacterized protein n=1 Tax=Aspergillus brasiliensis (strain CBS 101740 / IMI 381727 / IBT 21946) TaxID=767769 RepID=A0A1L9V2K9_ASPBC|nr:hypothetical protein ASPBRDRAFT_656467 [Aspergillus brasiliensis CBS 101740]
MSSAPFNIDVLKGPCSKRETKDLEASFARRTMMLVRRLLGQDGLLELLSDETAASREWWKEVYANSHGEWTPARIQLSARGLDSKHFIQWFLPGEGGMRPEPEKLAAHPEHWVVRPALQQPKAMDVLETLGERPTLFTLAFDLPASDFVQDNPAFPFKMTARGYLDDGTPLMELYHQFKDHEDGQGFDIDLAIYFPVAAGEDVVECHRQHLLVEFTNWLKQAYETWSA